MVVAVADGVGGGPGRGGGQRVGDAGDVAVAVVAAARLPKVTGPPVFLNPAQATTAASYLAANWAREVA
jgi:hypothetical protein